MIEKKSLLALLVLCTCTLSLKVRLLPSETPSAKPPTAH